MSKSRFTILCLLFLWSYLGQSALCSNEISPVAEQSIETIAETDQALLIELRKLAKFNVHFHLEANHHQPWRQLTYPISRETGTALTFSATLIDLNELADGLNNPARISKPQLKKALACGITGNAISGGASSLELAQNTWIMFKARRKGYSPASSIAFVKNVVAVTDRLLATRERLAEQELVPARRQVRDLETALVRRIRQQLLFEFASWSCHSRDQAWRENTFYTLDAAQNFTRMGAGILARKAFKNPQFARQAAVTALVANSVATINPIVRNVAGIVMRKHQEGKIAKEIPSERPPVLSLDELQQKLAVDADQDWLRKVTALTDRTQKFDTQLNRETREIERYRQVAQQQSISGPLIGLTGVTSSTLATVAVFGYPRDLVTATRLGFAGRITQGTGQAYALINTPYTVLKGMIINRRLKARGELPTQILKERLERLERFDGR